MHYAWLIGIFLLAAIAGVIILIVPGPQRTPDAQAPATTTAPAPLVYKDLVRVSAPLTHARAASPLAVKGEARGTWYFEASFPIEIRNASGTIIGKGVAQADGDWMTEEYVPFSASISFEPQPAGSSGTVLLKKDNPSGLPQHDDAVEIPVTF